MMNSIGLALFCLPKNMYLFYSNCLLHLGPFFSSLSHVRRNLSVMDPAVGIPEVTCHLLCTWLEIQIQFWEEMTAEISTIANTLPGPRGKLLVYGTFLKALVKYLLTWWVEDFLNVTEVHPASLQPASLQPASLHLVNSPPTAQQLRRWAHITLHKLVQKWILKP